MRTVHGRKVFIGVLLSIASIAQAQVPEYQGAWDGTCTATPSFFGPAFVAVSSVDAVYVLGINRVYRFESNGACVEDWPVYSGNVVHTISDMAIDSQDRVHVVDFGSKRGVTFNAQGDSLRTFGGPGTGPGQFNWLGWSGGIGVGPGDVLYVTDNMLFRVTRFSAQGTYLSHWSTLVGGEGVRLGSIAIDDSGHVFLADQQAHKVMKFTSTGSFLLSWGGPGSGPGQFASNTWDEGPDAITVGPDRRIYVSDQYNHRIQVFDTMGQYLYEWGTQGDGPYQFNRPYKLDFDALGNLYVPDAGNRRIYKYGPGPVPTLRSSWGSIKSRYR